MKDLYIGKDYKNPIPVDESGIRLAEQIAKRLKRKFSQSGQKVFIGANSLNVGAKPPKKLTEFTLEAVKHYDQRDSRVIVKGRNHAHRMCFTSVMTAIIEHYKPGTFKGNPNADDVHLKTVMSYGDTTDNVAQEKALAHHGIKARRMTNLNWRYIYGQLDKGNPTGIGIYHKGHINGRLYGGHWIDIVGRIGNTHLVVNDPYGELDLINGVYLPRSGKHKIYSKENLGKRWLADGPNAGWGMVVHSVDGVAV